MKMEGVTGHRIKPNRFYTIGKAGFDVATVKRLDPPEVLLGVSMEETGEEFEYTLRPGDTFPVDDQTWQVAEVVFPDNADWEWEVVVRRTS
ncbi:MULTISPECIES: DUF6406 domain-containing protein [Actinomadura]|uniref:Uncharacterized protein n=1 Tax=Actinomadura citrea TaxID=46158 RepID=A0A7Y9GIB0_9ACTN|nr:DUF6406 domain-containing protein [Actinomadura citrea]NYE16934.1 hypothetical protein [Actinomadura citrea]GGT59016.1 hypothetical protein GCM10010177_14390 [Actinomadura citrea]